MSILNLPRPAWMTEDIVLLEEQARRFIAAEYVPQLEAWNAAGMYGREVWTKAGAAGLLCPAIPEEDGGGGGGVSHEAGGNPAPPPARFLAPPPRPPSRGLA